MPDPTSHWPRANANQHVPETAQADAVRQADTESASGRTSSAVVARGTLLLSLLSQKAAAARAEAQCAELRMLLGEAQAGESTRLQRWLRIHAAEYLTECSPYLTECSPAYPSADACPPSEATLQFETPLVVDAELVPQGYADSGGDEKWRSEMPAGVDPLVGLNDWQTLLAPAQARLHAQAEKLKLESLSTSMATEECQVGRKKADGKTDGGASGHIRDKPVQRQRQMRVWRVRGALASMVAHGLLLLLLAWMTLRLPQPPAGLELQTTPVEWVPDALEVSQPIEMNSPEQPAAIGATQEIFDPSQALSQVTNNVGSTLSEMGTPLSIGVPSQSLLSASSGALGLAQSNTTFFGAAASGNCFCYVIDGSGSMRNGPWEAARFELLKSLASLTEKQRFYIIFFNRELSAIPLPGEQAPAPAALYATQENVIHTRRWLDTLRIGIGAPPNDALAMAIDKEPDAIYLLTDGVTSVDVAKFLRERNRISDLIAGEQIRVPIHTIAFYSLDGQDMLKQLAAENAGQFTYVPDPRR